MRVYRNTDGWIEIYGNSVDIKNEAISQNLQIKDIIFFKLSN